MTAGKRHLPVAGHTLTAELIPDLARAHRGNTESHARRLESPAETLAATMGAIRQNTELSAAVFSP